MTEIGLPPPHKTTHQDGGSDEINISGLTGAVEVVDTPADGETTKGISSNWAFDEDVTLRALIAAAAPWHIEINPFMTPKSQTNWATIGIATAQINNGELYSSGAQNDEIAWDVTIPAGTWTLEIITITAASKGILTVKIDDVSQGTIDIYSASTGWSSVKSIAGIVITTTGKKVLKFQMLTKNASSSGYGADLSAVRLTRTA